MITKRILTPVLVCAFFVLFLYAGCDAFYAARPLTLKEVKQTTEQTTEQTFGINLNQTGTYTFPAAMFDYVPQAVKSVSITNTGNQATGTLWITLSGTDSSSFTPSKTLINSLAVSGTGTFTVVPKTGLAAKTYTAMVTVSGGNGITASFNVSFTVNEAPSFAGKQKIVTPAGLSGVSFALRYVPRGSYQRDATATNITVISNGYWMGETEVTKGLFDAVMGSGHSNYFTTNPEGGAASLLPVEIVNWYAAIAFCNKLSIKDGKDPVYSVSGISDWANLAYSAIPTSSNATWNAATQDRSKSGYRLPTEAEWMWAAMGADKTVQPNRTGYSKAFAGSNGSNSIGDYAWYWDNSSSKTHEVGKKAANELGRKDMSGNVWEWCWDWYGTINSGTVTDPVGATSGSYRVLRGGSWDFDASGATVSDRNGSIPINAYGIFGFRLVCPPSSVE
jgi:formylglycine-generating enzyme required for sulfatase activity